MDASGLGNIVAGLLLRKVGDMARHGRRDDERSLAALSEVRTDRLCAVCRPVQVGLDHTVPILLGTIQQARIRRGSGAASL